MIRENPVEKARFQYETVTVQRHRTAAFPECKAIITSFLTQNYLCRAIGSTLGDMTTSLLRLRLLYQSSTIPPSAQKSNERVTRKQSDTKPHHWSKLYFTENPVETRWYPRPDSNRHASRRGILNPLRLPFRHLGTMGVCYRATRPAARAILPLLLDPVRLFWCCQLTDNLYRRNQYDPTAL